MLTRKRKLPAMHEAYGKRPPRKCRHCCNLRRLTIRGKDYLKCAAYGDTSNEDTDWWLNFLACGMFNIPIGNEVPLLERIKASKEDKP